MKKLKKILLINWLYFSKEIIEVGDVNFLTGKNGAGKSTVENGTRIRFAVYEYDESKKGEDLDENLRLKSVVPFQLAYAVSIHKAQGLEYDSVKVIIPSNNAEKITHGIFYTAITRAKTNLKIYWSSESMHDVVKGFATDESKRKSLEIVKTKLGKN